MAENEDNDRGSGGWPAFLSEVTKNFLILRDIFGYALPGVIFITIGVIWDSPFLDTPLTRLKTLNAPAWLLTVVGIGVCYTIGHVMAGIAYLPFNTWGLPYRYAFNPLKWLLQKSDPKAAETHFSDLIAIRGSHRELFTELERQSIMTQLRASTGMAMVLGWAFFCRGSGVGCGWTVATAGWFLLFTFWLSALPHIAELTKDTIAAAKTTKTVTPTEPLMLKQRFLTIIAAAQEAHDKLP